jgi:hypothetical protein
MLKVFISPAALDKVSAAGDGPAAVQVNSRQRAHFVIADAWKKGTGVSPHNVALDKVGGPLLNALAPGDFCNPDRPGVWHNRRSTKP